MCLDNSNGMHLKFLSTTVKKIGSSTEKKGNVFEAN